MNRVKELRLSMGMQQKELAIAVGVSRPTVSEWEHQKKDPKGERLLRLAELFGVAPGSIIGLFDSHTQASISDDEQVLLDRYRALSDDDKELLRSDALRMKREAEREAGTDAHRSAG